MADARLRNDPAIYDAAAEAWWGRDVAWLRFLRAMVPGRLRVFDPVVGDWTGKAVLDLGCAGGFMAEALDDRGARVTGVDPAEKAVAAARAHAAAGGRDIRYDVGVGEALPYQDGAFDVVVCVDVLEHVANLDQVLAEVARVLRPGGLFLFDTIAKGWLSRFLVVTMAEDVLGLLPKGAHDPALFIPEADLRARLRATGFEPGATTGLGPRGWSFADRAPVFGPVPMRAPIYIGDARKA